MLLFDHFGFRKVYFELPGYNLGLVDGWAGSILVEEGRLRDNCLFGGARFDQHIFALEQAVFEQYFSLLTDTDERT